MSILRKSILVFALPLLAGVVLACSSSSTSSSGATSTTGQKLSVGAPCTSDDQCGSSPFMCMMGDHPGGYCMRDCDISKGDADCPSEAICQYDGMVGECHLKCNSNSDCRSGYMCAPASNTATSKASHAFCDVADTSSGDGGTGG